MASSDVLRDMNIRTFKQLLNYRLVFLCVSMHDEGLTGLVPKIGSSSGPNLTTNSAQREGVQSLLQPSSVLITAVDIQWYLRSLTYRWMFSS
jgi:hypothetical protein